MSARLEQIKIGENYTFIENVNKSAEVVAFQKVEMPNCDYTHECEVVIYIDEEMNCQAMEINTFAISFC